MLRFSEIKPLFVDLSLSDKSFSYFVQLGVGGWGGGGVVVDGEQ